MSVEIIWADIIYSVGRSCMIVDHSLPSHFISSGDLKVMICELYPKANDLQFSMQKMPNELQESEASNKIYGCSTPSNGCIKYTNVA